MKNRLELKSIKKISNLKDIVLSIGTDTGSKFIEDVNGTVVTLHYSKEYHEYGSCVLMYPNVGYFRVTIIANKSFTLVSVNDVLIQDEEVLNYNYLADTEEDMYKLIPHEDLLKNVHLKFPKEKGFEVTMWDKQGSWYSYDHIPQYLETEVLNNIRAGKEI